MQVQKKTAPRHCRNTCEFVALIGRVALLVLGGFSASVWAQNSALVLASAEPGRVPKAITTPLPYALLPEAPTPASLEESSSSSEGQDEAGTPVSIKGFPKRVLFDELHVLTSPARTRKSDLRWLVPLAAATAISFGTDTKTMTDVVSHNASFNDSSATASDVIRDSFIGVPVGLFAFGAVVHNERAREAGLLSGEAMIDAYLVGELIKVATFRERPALDNARGAFYQRSAGLDSSFPSGHATVAWSSAAVLASEYHSPWQQAGIYTLATGVSLTRVMGQQHFPSDVLIGSAAGWLIGHYVYRAHHRHTGS